MLTVLIGPPGAGKTTWAQAQDALHLSTDAVRSDRFGRVDAHEHDEAVAAQFDADVLAAIRHGGSVIVENGANPRRLDYLAAARAAGLRAEAHVFENYERAEARSDVPRWVELADAARGAAAAVASEDWDAVYRTS